MRRLVPLFLALFVNAICSMMGAQTLPPVYFNHVTIFLPPVDYAALLQSTFLRNEFSAFEEQTVRADGGARSYTGIYLRGKHTYIELFKAGPRPADSGALAAPVGQVAFNMWIDDRNGLPLFSDRLAAEKNSSMEIGTARNGQNLPNYDYVGLRGVQFGYVPGLLISSVVKGYYPDGITREKRLAPRFLADRLLQDVVGFTVTVSETERKLLLQEFRAYSYAIHADGEKQIASGPEVTFTLVPEKKNVRRALILDLVLNREKTGAQTVSMDDVNELRFQDRTAKWVVTFPGN
jgi:hypothetical protein